MDPENLEVTGQVESCVGEVAGAVEQAGGYAGVLVTKWTRPSHQGDEEARAGVSGGTG